jgi:hypothetical protein
MTRQRALRLLTLDALAGNKLLLEGMQKLHWLLIEGQLFLPWGTKVEFRLPRGRQVRLLLGSMRDRKLPGAEVVGEGLRVVGRASSRSQWQRLDHPGRNALAPVVEQVQSWGGPEGLAELLLAIERARKLVLRELDKGSRWL